MAIGIENKPQINPADAEYPYGDIKDAPAGTPVNRLVYGDIHQFFRKLMSIAGLVPNNLRDNETNGYQYIDALRIAAKPYNVWVGKVSQTGTAAPTAVVLQNELGGTIVWTRSSAGLYIGTLVGAFPAANYWAMIKGTGGGITTNVERYEIVRFSDDALTLLTRDNSGAIADSLIDSCELEIRVYR